MKLQYQFAAPARVGTTTPRLARSSLRRWDAARAFPGTPDDPIWQSIDGCILRSRPALVSSRRRRSRSSASWTTTSSRRRTGRRGRRRSKAGGHRTTRWESCRGRITTQREAKVGNNAEMGSLQRFVPEYSGHPGLARPTNSRFLAEMSRAEGGVGRGKEEGLGAHSDGMIFLSLSWGGRPRVPRHSRDAATRIASSLASSSTSRGAQDRLAVLDHRRMAAEMRHALCRISEPLIGVLPDDVVHPADLAGPAGVVPRPAHGRHVDQPWEFTRELHELVVVAELRGLAGALDQEQPPIALSFPPRASCASVRTRLTNGATPVTVHRQK